MFLQKYKPRVLEEVLGHADEIRRLRTWINSADYSKPIFLTGPTGCGKTLIAHLLAYQSGYEIQEFSLAIDPNPNLNLSNRRLFPTLIIIDDADLISDQAALIATLKTNKSIPIVLIATEVPYKLKTLAGHCLHIALKPVPLSTIEDYVRRIVKKEGLAVNVEDVCAGGPSASVDIRHILNNLEAEPGKDTTYNMYSAFTTLMPSPKNAPRPTRSVLERAAETDAYMLPLMLQETYPVATSNITKTADLLAYGDILDQYIHHTHDWTLLPYSVSNSVSVALTYKKQSPPSFPTWLGKNSSTQRKIRGLAEVSAQAHYKPQSYRLDVVSPLDIIVGMSSKPADMLHSVGLTRDDYIDVVRDVVFDPVALSAAQKSAITREYKKVGRPTKLKPKKCAEVKHK